MKSVSSQWHPFPSISPRDLIVNDETIGNTETNTRNHGPPFSLLLLPLFLVFFTIFLVARTLFESALSPRGYNCCSVSWKKKKKEEVSVKNRGRREQREWPLFLPIFISLLPGEEKREILAPVSYREKGGGSRCLPDVSDASVPLATTIYGRKSTMWLPRFQIYRDFERVNHVLDVHLDAFFFWKFDSSWYNLKIANLVLF